MDAHLEAAIDRRVHAGPLAWLASRQTFLIGPDGKIVKHWDKVDPKGHSDMVLVEIKAHSPATKG